MTYELRRRLFLRRMGQMGGLAVAGGALEELVSACGGNVATGTVSGTSKVENQGLKVASLFQWGSTTNGGAPYVFQDPRNPAELVGFEVEVADAIAALMGSKQKQIETDYQQLESALQANKFDAIMDGWEITPDRQKTELFSQSYYHYGQQIVVKADDHRFASKTTKDRLSLVDLEGLTVGTGGAFKAADILASDKKITLKTYDPDLPFNDLALGRIDAVLIDVPIVAYYILGAGPGSQADARLRPIGKPFELSDYVIAFKRGNSQAETLVKEVDQALSELKKNGTLRKIYQKWSLWNDDQAQIGIE